MNRYDNFVSLDDFIETLYDRIDTPRAVEIFIRNKKLKKLRRMTVRNTLKHALKYLLPSCVNTNDFVLRTDCLLPLSITCISSLMFLAGESVNYDGSRIVFILYFSEGFPCLYVPSHNKFTADSPDVTENDWLPEVLTHFNVSPYSPRQDFDLDTVHEFTWQERKLIK